MERFVISTDEDALHPQEGNAIKGAFWGVLLSIPLWAIIIAAVVGIKNLLGQ